MYDLQKKVDALISELKCIKREKALMKQENIYINNQLSDSITRCEALTAKNNTLTKENSELKLELLQQKRYCKQKERFYENKIKKNMYFDQTKTSKNKVENVLRHECKELKVVIGVYEQIMEKMGESLNFDGIIMNELIKVVDNVDDFAIKKVLNNIISRNKTNES